MNSNGQDCKELTNNFTNGFVKDGKRFFLLFLVYVLECMCIQLIFCLYFSYRGEKSWNSGYAERQW